MPSWTFTSKTDGADTHGGPDGSSVFRLHKLFISLSYRVPEYGALTESQQFCPLPNRRPPSDDLRASKSFRSKIRGKGFQSTFFLTISCAIATVILPMLLSCRLFPRSCSDFYDSEILPFNIIQYHFRCM